MTSTMKLLKWTTVFIAQFILTQHMTHGRPLTSSSESDLHGDLNNHNHDVLGQLLPTKQSFQSFADNAGDDESKLLNENEEWSVTQNYEPISEFEKETSNSDFPELPFNIIHPTLSLSSSDLPIIPNSKKEIEENLDLYYESSTIDSGFKDKSIEPSELLKFPAIRTGSMEENNNVGTALDLAGTLIVDDSVTLPNESIESPQNVSEYQLNLDRSDVRNDDTSTTYSTYFNRYLSTKTILTTYEKVIKTATTPFYSSTIDQQFTNDTSLESHDNIDTQFTTSTVDFVGESEIEEDISVMSPSVTTGISPTFDSPTAIIRLKEFTRLFPTLSTDIISSIQSNPGLSSTSESPFLANSTNYDYNDQSTTSNLPIFHTSSQRSEEGDAVTVTTSIPESSTFDYEVIEPTDLYQPELNVSLESDLNEDNETISGYPSTKFRSLWNLISVEMTNTVIIGAIAGGCAIIFLSLIMICCLYRKQDSGNLNSPPTESSNCSSNSSASSFPAAKSG